MAAGQANLDIYQGDDPAWRVTVMTTANTPADITGYTASAQIRRAVADVDPVVVATLATTVTSPDVFLSLTHTQTALLSGRYVWDLQLTSAGGAVTTILEGNVIVTSEVTRAAAV
jgi:hypothetical protein